MWGLTGSGFRRLTGAVATLVVVALVGASAASAQPTPFQSIVTSGPLTPITVGADLSCQVGDVVDSSPEFFPPNPGVPGDCGTFLSVNASAAVGIPPALFGPAFTDHTATATAFPTGYQTFSPVTQTITGTGTPQVPYVITTVDTVTDGNITLTVTEGDTYIVGSDFYLTSVAVLNTSNRLAFSGKLYHAGDCFLRGLGSGYGSIEATGPDGATAACTINANNSPPSALEEMIPLTAGAHYTEERFGNDTSPGSDQIWGDIGAQRDFANNCDCTTQENNAEGIDWDITSLAAGATDTFNLETKINDPAITATGGTSLTGTAGNGVSGTLATITDSNTNTAPGDYTATVNWGDGSSDQNATITGGSGTFQVADSHTYAAAGVYTITVSISYNSNPGNTAMATDHATISASQLPPPVNGRPAVTLSPAVVTGTTSAQVAGSVTPNGLPTTAYFQYQLAPSFAGPGGPPQTVLTTPVQQVGSDFTNHPVMASLTGLVPNAQYEVQLIATNSSGPAPEPPQQQMFATKQDPPPPLPVIGKSENVSVVSGKVYIKPPPGKNFGGAADNVGASAALSKGQGFVPLTEARQIPTGSEIDTLNGTLKLVTAGLSVGKTQTATLSGGVYQTTQISKGINKGLTNLNLVYGAFQGGPTLQKCMAPKKKSKAPDAQIARLNLSILQTLRASARGRFRTRGRYAAATIRGTIWSISDLCSGTRVRAIRDTVLVQDFVRHKTILLRPGRTYLALAFQKRRK
jgi:hypothetical protein